MSRPERVVVALSGGAVGRALLQRAAALASRSPGGELHSLHVQRPGRRDADPPADLARLRDLTTLLGGTHHEVTAPDPAEAVLDFARGIDATSVMVGASRRGRLRDALRDRVSDRLVDGAGDLDVLVVRDDRAGRAHDPARASALSGGRRLTGWLLAVAGPLLLTVVGGTADRVPTSQALGFLALTVLVALVGGLWPAVVGALLGSLLLTYFFTAPVHTLGVDHADDVVSLGLFVVVAVAVASVVDVSARRAVQADLARREADALSMLNRALLRSGYGVEELLEQVCETFAMAGATLLRRGDGPAGDWVVVARHGSAAPRDEGGADACAEADDVRLLLSGRPLPPHDLRVLGAFATHLAVVLARAELGEQAAAAQRLAEGNRMRTALLAAVSHDLRTPLAGVKAAVSMLRTPDVAWQPDDQEALLEAIEDSADRLTGIVANLLDMSRLQTGGVTLVLHEVGLDDVVARAVTGLPDGRRVSLHLPDDLPAVRVDAGLLDRVVANLVDNALRHTRSAVQVRAEAAQAEPGAEARVRLLVVDQGPGVPDAVKPSLFEPFQRLGDAPAGEGVGLGLAVAKGLTEAMGGSLRASDSPGSGLTMTVELPAVEVAARPEAAALGRP